MSNEYPPPNPGPDGGQEPEGQSDQAPPPPPPPSEPQWNPQSAGPPPAGYGQDPSAQDPYGQPQYGQSRYNQLPGYPPQGPGAPGGYGMMPQQKTSPLAITSLVLGILGIPCCSLVVLGIAAIVTGFIARQQISRSQGQLKGDGMALAGLILGVVGVLVGIILLVLRFSGGLDSSFNMNP